MDRQTRTGDTVLVKNIEMTGKDQTTEYTELQPLLSGVHSVTRVKLALAGEGGVHGARPPLITFTITSEVAVYAPAEWEDTQTLFHLEDDLYSVAETPQPHFSANTRALLVSQDRRHLFVTPWRFH